MAVKAINNAEQKNISNPKKRLRRKKVMPGQYCLAGGAAE
jgi:hypothetical protein